MYSRSLTRPKHSDSYLYVYFNLKLCLYHIELENAAKPQRACHGKVLTKVRGENGLVTSVVNQTGWSITQAGQPSRLANHAVWSTKHACYAGCVNCVGWFNHAGWITHANWVNHGGWVNHAGCVNHEGKIGYVGWFNYAGWVSYAGCINDLGWVYHADCANHAGWVNDAGCVNHAS